MNAKMFHHRDCQCMNKSSNLAYFIELDLIVIFSINIFLTNDKVTYICLNSLFVCM